MEFTDGAFLGDYGDLAPAIESSPISFDDGAFLGAYEDMPSAAFDTTYLGDLGFGDGLSPLQSYYLTSNHIPEVSAGGASLGDWQTALGSSGDALTGGFNAAKDSQLANLQGGLGPYVAPSDLPEQEGFLSKVMRGMGLKGKNGQVDLSDPKQLQAWMRLILAGGGVLQAFMQRKPANYQSPQDLLNAQGGGTKSMGWSPQQQASADAFFNKPAEPWQNKGIHYAGGSGGVEVAGKTYASGGPVDYAMGGYAHGGGPAAHLDDNDDTGTGALGQVAGGQDDVIDARLAPGEFVWDADTVSAFGDGNNDTGAKKLEAVRQAIRAHKRSAPPNKIPPRAKPFHQYAKTKGAK